MGAMPEYNRFGGGGVTGTGVPKRTVGVNPLPPMTVCKDCEPLATQLRTAHQELQRLAQRANDVQIESDFEAFEQQRVKVAQLQTDLENCVRTKCSKSTTTNTSAGNDSTPTTGTTGTTTGTTNTTGTTTTPIDAPPTVPIVPKDVKIEASGTIDPKASGTTTIQGSRVLIGDATTAVPGADDGVLVGGANACSGAECSDEWNACSATNSCTPIDRDCGVPGTCSSASGGMPSYNLNDPSGWSSAANADTEPRIQIKMGEVFIDVVIREVRQADIRSWFNPLGLVAKRMVDNVERWRGSVGPRPLINPRDLREVEKYSSGQSLGLPKGVHVLLTDRGGSTGKTLAMQVLNLTGQPVRLASMPFAIEPIKQQAQARVQQAFTRLTKAAPMSVDLAGYCVEFLKLPPAANQIFRLAPAAVQKKYESMSRVLRSAYRVQQAGLLRPDSNPEAYADAIKQWALWTVEQKFDQARFTDAFLSHTKKNVEAAGQPWPKQAEEMIRKVSPNRWRDIGKILQGAGLPVPQ
jgi:hypothetical protein